MSDAARLADPIAALESLPRGAALILRHYGQPGRAEMARRLVRAARPLGVRIFIAGDWRLAIRTGAAGVHLPEAALGAPLSIGPAVRAKKLFVTAAAHSAMALLLAGKRGVSAALLGPVFPTRSHPGRAALGPLRFAALCRLCPVPVIALGGIDARSARKIRASGAAGIAGIGGIAGPGAETGARKVMARRGRLV